jgi:hypothetical protein
MAAHTPGRGGSCGGTRQRHLPQRSVPPASRQTRCQEGNGSGGLLDPGYRLALTPTRLPIRRARHQLFRRARPTVAEPLESFDEGRATCCRSLSIRHLHLHPPPTRGARLGEEDMFHSTGPGSAATRYAPLYAARKMLRDTSQANLGDDLRREPLTDHRHFVEPEKLLANGAVTLDGPRSR